ncbi:MAG: SIS domain-containing protein [Gemmatimonadota bacterium]
MSAQWTFTQQFLSEVAEIARRVDAVSIDRMALALSELRKRNGRLFLLGVGGSAANASHAAGDFRKLAGIEAYSGADNTTEITARTNDQGWDHVFAEYLKSSRLGSNDAVLVFSVGGGSLEPSVSANLVYAMMYAREVGATVLAVVGRDGGFAAGAADYLVLIPAVNPNAITPHTEAFQSIVWHLLVSHPALAAAAPHWETVEPLRTAT